MLTMRHDSTGRLAAAYLGILVVIAAIGVVASSVLLASPSAAPQPLNLGVMLQAFVVTAGTLVVVMLPAMASEVWLAGRAATRAARATCGAVAWAAWIGVIAITAAGPGAVPVPVEPVVVTALVAAALGALHASGGVAMSRGARAFLTLAGVGAAVLVIATLILFARHWGAAV